MRAAALCRSASASVVRRATRPDGGVVPYLARRMTAAPHAAAARRRSPVDRAAVGVSAANAAAANAAASTAANAPPSPKPTVLLLDVMDTLVADPFYEAMPRHFNLPFRDLLDQKHPTAWLEFERGDIDEERLLASFFRDGRPVDGPALVAMMRQHYRLLDGIEPLLDRLSAAQVEMHACSNYPVWWRNVEGSTGLSKWLRWTFVSCEGPMRVEFF
jgi:hypothetical protein